MRNAHLCDILVTTSPRHIPEYFAVPLTRCRGRDGQQTRLTPPEVGVLIFCILRFCAKRGGEQFADPRSPPFWFAWVPGANCWRSSHPSEFKDNATHPVEQVSWDDVQRFLARLNEASLASQLKFALPTEAQWEYACRAGTTTRHHGDKSDLQEFAWFVTNSRRHDTSGGKRMLSVCMTSMATSGSGARIPLRKTTTAKSSENNPVGPTTGSGRVGRGGRWNNRSDMCRSAYRDYYPPDYRTFFTGFRLAMTIDSAKLTDAGSEETTGSDDAQQPDFIKGPRRSLEV